MVNIRAGLQAPGGNACRLGQSPRYWKERPGIWYMERGYNDKVQNIGQASAKVAPLFKRDNKVSVKG